MKTIPFLILFTLLTGCTVHSDPFVRPDDWARPIMSSQLDNFYKVDDHLFRSSQPGRNDVDELKQLGITSVLNLRNYHSDDDEFNGSSINLLRVPMNAGEVSEAQITEALKAIQQSEGPVLVHCWHGSDRTGAVVAAYRMVMLNWPKQAAIEEFKLGGYGYHESFYRNLETLLQQLNVEKIQEQLNLHKTNEIDSQNPTNSAREN